MAIYRHGQGNVVGAKNGESIVWWYGSGVASAGLCGPKVMTLAKARRVLPVAQQLLERARGATY